MTEHYTVIAATPEGYTATGEGAARDITLAGGEAQFVDLGFASEAVRNQAPILDSIGDKWVDEEQTLTFMVSATDPDEDNVSLFAVALPLGASFNASTGVFTWTPIEMQDGTFTVTFTATDDGSPRLSDSETITITVNEVNNAPVLDSIGNQIVAEEDTLTFIVTASDANDDPANDVTLSVTGLPSGASFNADTGVFAWTPTEAQEGAYEVTFTARDNGSPNLSDSETITITVGEVNDPPVLGAIGNKTINEETALSFTVTASDADDTPANTVTLSASGLPSGATFNATTGVFSWTPTKAQQGTYTVTFTATDNGSPNLTDTETITITVNEVNAAPVLAAIGNKTVNELSTLAFTATASDSDVPAQTLTYSLSGTVPAGAAINASTGAFSWTPTETQAPGTYTFNVVISDGSATDSETITVTVVEVNAAPVLAAIGNKTVNEKSLLSFTVTATDPNDTPANTVTLSATGLPTGATFNATTGVFNWTPTEAQGPGTYTVTFTATDNGSPNLTDSETITITVNEVNSAPVLAAIGNRSVVEGQNVSFTVSASDPNDTPANTVTLSATGLPTGATFNPTTGVFSWTPTLAQAGVYTVTFTATDNGSPNLTDSETITISVGAVNQAPVLAAIGNKTVNERSALSFTVSATDPDDDTVTLSATGLPTGATFNASTGVFSWTPTEAQQGTYTVTFTARDNGSPNLTDTETITITVAEANHAPILSDDFYETYTDTQLTFNANTLLENDTEPDGNSMEVVSINTTPDTEGTVILDDGAITFTPKPNFSGETSFEYVVADSFGAQSTGTVYVNVLPEMRLVLSLNFDEVNEGDGYALGSLGSLDGPVTNDLVVTLLSGSPDDLTLPATVTIRGGQTTAAFMATIIDDSLPESTEHVMISATAAGWTDAVATLTIHDNDESTPGDLNGDGQVNSRDLDIVRAWWRMSVEPGRPDHGDPSGDGLVGSADLDIVRANWGTGAPVAAGASSGNHLGDGFRSPTCPPPLDADTVSSSRADAAFENWDSAKAAWSNALEELALGAQSKVKTARRRDAVDFVFSGLIE